MIDEGNDERPDAREGCLGLLIWFTDALVFCLCLAALVALLGIIIIVLTHLLERTP